MMTEPTSSGSCFHPDENALVLSGVRGRAPGLDHPDAGPMMPSSDLLHVNDELFVIPDGDRYILYAPLERAALRVNTGTIAALREFRRGNRSRIASDAGLMETLARAGVLISDSSSTRARKFERNGTGFDPTGLTLFLTTTCSMRCVYCYAGGGDKPRDMPWPVAKAAIDWIVAHTLSRSRKSFYASFHGGGEVTTAFSLMNGCVRYIRRQARRHRISVTLDAGLNGVMSPQVVDWVVRNLDGATVSLDGVPEVQNGQRPLADGRGSFDAVAATLRRMEESGFRYSIRATVTCDSVDRLAESVGFISSRYKPRRIQVEPVHVAGRAAEHGLVAVPAERFVENFRRAALAGKANGVELTYSGARLSTITNVFCKAAMGNSFAVTPDGAVTSCYEVMDGDDPRASLFHIGNLDPVAGRFELYADRVRALGSLTVENKTQCARCFCKWHCAGDCPAKRVSAEEDWDASGGPRCYINRELTKDQLMLLLSPDGATSEGERCP